MTTTGKIGVQQNTYFTAPRPPEDQPALARHRILASIFGVKRAYITHKYSVLTSKTTQPFFRKVNQRMFYRTRAVYCKDHMEGVKTTLCGENAYFIP
jgi:hypothetical protein